MNSMHDHHHSDAMNTMHHEHHLNAMNSMHHHHHSSQPSPLDIRELADFDASLGDISESEKRQRRIIYLRNALQQADLGKNMVKGFGCMMVPFMIIPIFWPFLYFFRKMNVNMANMLDIQANNALDYWKIDRSEIFPNHQTPASDRRDYY